MPCSASGLAASKGDASFRIVADAALAPQNTVPVQQAAARYLATGSVRSASPIVAPGTPSAYYIGMADTVRYVSIAPEQHLHAIPRHQPLQALDGLTIGAVALASLVAAELRALL